MRGKILKVLFENMNEFISGEELSEELGVSRTAIWKHIKKLKEEGYEIESVTKRGHRLMGYPDIISKQLVETSIDTKYIGKKVVFINEVGSTNDEAKMIAQEEIEGTIVISEIQTKGRGRRGRNWHSKEGSGIWMSIILKPKISPSEAPFITQIVGAGIIRGFEKLGIDAKIKWPNDIIINDKKVCGILTEMNMDFDGINYVVAGIGINVNTISFPDDLKEIATSIKLEKYEVSRLEIIQNILPEIERLYDKFIKDNDKKEVIAICKSRSNIIGEKINVIKESATKEAKAIDITSEGNLLVEYEDLSTEEINSGEVSIRRNLND